MIPPIEKASADSDIDSDQSDDPDGNINHLPGRLLSTDAELSRGKRATEDETDAAATEEDAEELMAAKKLRMTMDPIYGDVPDFSSGTTTTTSTTTATTITTTFRFFLRGRK